MAKIQPCRNGCGTQITVQLDEASGKYKPYEIDDNTGDYELHNCPNSPYNQQNKSGFKPQQTQQQQQPKTNFYGSNWKSTTPTDVPKTSQGGLPLDTKRLLQAVVELTKEIHEMRDEIKNNVQIDSARYENQMDIIYNRLSDETKDQMFKSAADLDAVTTNHSKIADDKQNFMQPRKDRVPSQTKFVDESKPEKQTLDERIPDNKDEFAIEQALKDDLGVIEED